MKNLDGMQKLGKDGVDATLQSFTVASKGIQVIAGEYVDYARKSFELGTATFEKLLGARTLDRAIEVQTDFAKTAYEGFVAQAAKIGELYADVAKQAYKPLEGYAAKVTPVT